MKIKLFWATSGFKDLEETVNEFTMTHDVVDIKIVESSFGESENINNSTTIMVMYR